MGKQLYETQPIFRPAIDNAPQSAEESEGIDLPDILWGSEAEKIHETANTQVALFAIEWALAQLWKSWGVEPAAILGHSVGEYVGVTVAGVYSLQEGLKLIALRGADVRRPRPRCNARGRRRRSEASSSYPGRRYFIAALTMSRQLHPGRLLRPNQQSRRKIHSDSACA